MARLQDTPPSNVSRVHVHARVQIQRGALPREKVRSLVAQRSPQDGSGQGSTVPHSHATSTSAHGCRCLAPRPSLAGARITQYLGKGLGQTRANGMVTPRESPGGSARGARGKEPGGGEPGGGRVACSSHRSSQGEVAWHALLLRSVQLAPPGGPPRGDQSIELTRSSSLTAAASVLRSCCGASAPIVINGASRMSLCL